MTRHAPEHRSGAGNPGEVEVTLPAEPPLVTESVAASLLDFLRVLGGDLSQACPRAGGSAPQG